MQAVSIAEEFDGQGRIHDKVRVLLNTGRSWSRGRLGETVSNLLVESSVHGSLAAVITTNFDDRLEQEIQQACQRSTPPVVFRRALVPPAVDVLEPGAITR